MHEAAENKRESDAHRARLEKELESTKSIVEGDLNVERRKKLQEKQRVRRQVEAQIKELSTELFSQKVLLNSRALPRPRRCLFRANTAGATTCSGFEIGYTTDGSCGGSTICNSTHNYTVPRISAGRGAGEGIVGPDCPVFLSIRVCGRNGRFSSRLIVKVMLLHESKALCSSNRR